MSPLTPVAKVYRAYALLPFASQETQSKNCASVASSKDTKAKKQKAASTSRCKKKSKAANTDDSESMYKVLKSKYKLTTSRR